MNILECTKKFQEMEIEQGLFKLHTPDGVYFWDIVRYDVFYFIFRDNLNSKPKQSLDLKSNKSKFSLSKIAYAVKTLISDYIYLYANSKSKYVFFKCSRNLIDGKETDIISTDYLSIIGDECFIIETFGNSRDNDCFLNSVLRYKKKFSKLFKNKLENYYIDQIINNTFGLDLHLDDFIRSRVENFRLERKHYTKLLKRLKPKAVFFVQNGIHKSLLYSCRELGVPSIELQHGTMNYCHQAYSYPIGVEEYKHKEVIVPDALFAFSDYWIKNVNYPVKEAIAMGNTYYSIPNSPICENQDEITFISANIYEKKIEIYLDYMLDKYPNTKINLKLHPNQKGEIDQINAKYSKYKNIQIYYNEVTLHELFKKSKEVILVTSTAAYEAIQFGCSVGIIKDDLSYDIEDLFNHTNVMLLEKPSDLFNKCKSKPIKTVFFDGFNEDKMKNFIKLL